MKKIISGEQSSNIINSSNQRLKNAGLLVVYWVLFIIFPCNILTGIVTKRDFPDTKYNTALLSIYGYMVFISPIILVAISKMAKFQGKSEKRFFIILGLLSPYIGMGIVFAINHIPFGSGPHF